MSDYEISVLPSAVSVELTRRFNFELMKIQGSAITLKRSAETLEMSLQWVRVWVQWLLAYTLPHMQALKEYHFRSSVRP